MVENRSFPSGLLLSLILALITFRIGLGEEPPSRGTRSNAEDRRGVCGAM